MILKQPREFLIFSPFIVSGRIQSRCFPSETWTSVRWIFNDSKMHAIPFPSLLLSYYRPSVPPLFTSGLSCVSPGAVSICAGEPELAKEVMDYIRRRCFISIEKCLRLQYRRKRPELFYKMAK